MNRSIFPVGFGHYLSAIPVRSVLTSAFIARVIYHVCSLVLSAVWIVVCAVVVWVYGCSVVVVFFVFQFSVFLEGVAGVGLGKHVGLCTMLPHNYCYETINFCPLIRHVEKNEWKKRARSISPS